MCLIEAMQLAFIIKHFRNKKKRCVLFFFCFCYYLGARIMHYDIVSSMAVRYPRVYRDVYFLWE